MRHDRQRHGWVAGALLGLGVVLLAVTLLNAAGGGGDASAKRDARTAAPSVTATEAVPGTVPQFDLNVDVALEGPLAEVAEIEVIPDEHPLTAAIGYPFDNSMTVVIRTTGDQDVELPTLRPDVDSWTGEGDRLTASLAEPRPAQVVAGGPAGMVGQIVESHEVPAWLPRLLYLQLQSTDLLTETSARDLTIPLGDSALHLTVTFTPSARPQIGTLVPADADGTVVAVPPVGEATAVALSDGTPVWIANTEAFGVTVVAGRTPFRPDGIVQVTRWCPSSEGFYELHGGSRFSGDGTYAFGPAPGGLATYQVEPAGEGQVRIVGGQAGTARPPPKVWPPPTGEDGFPVSPPETTGPWCNDGTPAGPDGVGLQVDRYPVATVDRLVGATGRFQFEGRLVLDTTGTGQLCTPVEDPLECVGPSIPVNLSAFTGPRAGPHDSAGDGLRAYDAPVVVTVGEGVIREVWMDGWFIPNFADEGARTGRVIGRVTDVRLGADEADCAGYPATTPCAGVVELESLQIYDQQGPISNVPSDNVLPDNWVVVDEFFGDSDSSALLRLRTDDPVADGTPLADIPQDRLVVLTQTGDVVSDVSPLQVAD